MRARTLSESQIGTSLGYHLDLSCQAWALREITFFSGDLWLRIYPTQVFYVQGRPGAAYLSFGHLLRVAREMNPLGDGCLESLSLGCPEFCEGKARMLGLL